MHLQKLFKFATIYSYSAGSEHFWAAGIVNTAFQQVMGRAPTPAERQIVMAVSNLESNYGKGWKAGQGAGSHNWGAVQTRSKKGPQFEHKDSSAEGSYTTGFKAYPDDVAGAADVVKILFKGSRKQQMPDPKRGQRTLGGEIPGPTRGELIEQAAQAGDTLAFSRAMWYTTYFEGFKPDFTENIKSHAQGIQNRLNAISSALGEPIAWSIKSSHYLPVTTDQAVLNKIVQINPKAGSAQAQEVAQTPAPTQGTSQAPVQEAPPSAIESQLWFS